MLALAARHEARSATLQSLLFSWRAGAMTWAVAPGPSGQAQFPHSGPYDDRLGYKHLARYIEALGNIGYVIDKQARVSRTLERFIDTGGYAIYREKPRAGLTLLGHEGAPLFSRQFPKRAFDRYDAVPPVIVKTLLFLEDRELLDADAPRRNPAVQWPRFLRAVAGQAAGLLNPEWKQGGGSTLATQIEKFRHFPGGQTRSAADKLRQMRAASLRAYLSGQDTREARRDIIATYLDSTPLGSRTRHGEVIGVGDGLWAWYGTNLAEVRAVFDKPALSEAWLSHKAALYKQVLSLLLAQRRPAYFLMSDREALEARTNLFLGLLADAGVIDAKLRDAARAEPLRFRPAAPPPEPYPAPGRKAADLVRVHLLSALRLPSLAVLDQIDLTVQSTIDTPAQLRVSQVLRRLTDREYVRSLGLVGKDLLGNREQLDRVTYSMVLYESSGDRNLLRIRADSLDAPFDINSGAKLILGSTAKLRTLITYLNVIAELHGRLVVLPPSTLRYRAERARDPLSRWAAEYLVKQRDRSLSAMLEAAMQRTYRASPHEVFFTGGGEHVFHNYKNHEDREIPTVEDAFRRSVNLSFVRLMRDISDYYIARSGVDAHQMLADPDHPGRRIWLARFAEREGRSFTSQFLKEYRGKNRDAALAALARKARASAAAQTLVFRSVRPRASMAELADFLRTNMGARAPDAHMIAKLYAEHEPGRFDLADRGYLARVHPLELWTVAYLEQHPGATREQALRASTSERQLVYRWLFNTRNAEAQNQRIRVLLEEDSFGEIRRDWQRQGYPFERLVPSLATAIGSSGDRPDALASLMGVILNQGMKLPDTDIAALRFAEGTPYETHLGFRPPQARSVMAPEVAKILRKALEGVVASGSGQRLRGVYRNASCEPLTVGGKTGTSDERFKTFGSGGRVISERPVNRSATFVFFLGERFYGTVTAYVAGVESAQYHFTSSFAVQLLRSLAPELQDLLGTASPEVSACRIAST